MSSAPRVLLWCLLLLHCVGCGPRAWKINRNTLDGMRTGPPHTLELGIVHEPTAPPGFVPAETVETDGTTERVGDQVWLGEPVASGRSGLVTLVVIYNDYHGLPWEVGRVKHVDGAASVYGDSEYLYFPVVGASGERLTQVVLDSQPRPFSSDSARKFKRRGAPLPRVQRLAALRKFDGYFARTWGARIAFGIPQVDRPGLYTPVSNGARVALPQGAVGAMPIASMDTTRDWIGWLVRWEGAGGTGWSLSVDPKLAAFTDRGPRWSDITVVTLEKARVVVGKRSDGTCEVGIVQSWWSVQAEKEEWDGVVGGGATCDAALQVAFAETAQKYEDHNKDVAARVAAQEAAEKQRALDAAEQARVVAKYKALVAEGKYDEACNNTYPIWPANQSKLLIERLAAPDYRESEYKCFTSTAIDQGSAVADARRKQRGESPVADGSVPPGGGGSSGASGSPSSPDYARQAKAHSDYLYGSGRGSTCPFSSYICR